jgi:hypothetical protein
VPGAYVCNSSYTGDRDQEDCSWKPNQENSSARPYLEKLFTKIELMKWFKVKTLNSSLSTSPTPTKIFFQSSGDEKFKFKFTFGGEFLLYLFLPLCCFLKLYISCPSGASPQSISLAPHQHLLCKCVFFTPVSVISFWYTVGMIGLFLNPGSI